jgi:hypothetical protein
MGAVSKNLPVFFFLFFALFFFLIFFVFVGLGEKSFDALKWFNHTVWVDGGSSAGVKKDST